MVSVPRLAARVAAVVPCVRAAGDHEAVPAGARGSVEGHVGAVDEGVGRVIGERERGAGAGTRGAGLVADVVGRAERVDDARCDQ